MLTSGRSIKSLALLGLCVCCILLTVEKNSANAYLFRQARGRTSIASLMKQNAIAKSGYKVSKHYNPAGNTRNELKQRTSISSVRRRQKFVASRYQARKSKPQSTIAVVFQSLIDIMVRMYKFDSTVHQSKFYTETGTDLMQFLAIFIVPFLAKLYQFENLLFTGSNSDSVGVTFSTTSKPKIVQHITYNSGTSHELVTI
mmetsp:Transcript_27731/g.40973  ORF Transcript_27731/g.40973 Transcript_27731/m.40973 type:complete len:200 (-) Transcript_27731:343-942(-)